MPELHNLSPDDILAESLSKRVITSQLSDPAKMGAFFAVARIAIKTVIRAGAAGNVQCQQAVREMEPKLLIFLKK
jgi:hypothetical protein